MTETRSRKPFANRDFRLLWIGEAVSSIGDQFAFIALPWLALVLTGSALALGSVLALMAIPRPLLMLLGGVSVDRLSPRRVMLVVVAGLGMALLCGVTLLLPTVRNLGLVPTYEATLGETSGPRGASESDAPAAAGASPASA